MFVFYNNDLLIIQMDLGDEESKYIAYKQINMIKYVGNGDW